MMFIGFLPKLVLRSALMSPLSVPNFSPIGARIHVLWQILQSVRKEAEETKRSCILEMAGVIVSIFGM